MTHSTTDRGKQKRSSRLRSFGFGALVRSVDQETMYGWLATEPELIHRFLESQIRQLVAELDAFLVQFGQLAVDHIFEDVHQPVHLFARPAPVLGGEGVDGQVLDPIFHAGGDDVAQVLRAGPMPCQPRQPARNGPAPVPVHNNGDVGGN